jgi:exopolysaccharide biosynthesis polyprenyl glycosylphosphotransferase
MRVYGLYIQPLTVVLVTADISFTLLVTTAYSRGPSVWAVRPMSQSVLSYPFVLAGCLLLPTFAMGLYQRSFLTLRKFPSRALLAFLLGLVLIALYVRWDPSHDASLTDALLIAAICFIGLLGNRVAIVRLASLKSLTRNVTTVGPFEEMTELSRLQLALRPPGFSVSAHVEVNRSSGSTMEAALETKSHDIVISDNDELLDVEALLRLRFADARVVRMADFIEQERRFIHPRSPEARRLLLVPGRSRLSRAIKRGLDVIISMGALLFCAPLAAAIVLAVWLSDGRPIIYRQVRLGLNGRSFEILKFRSMRVDAERNGVARWADVNDRRVTPIGAFLRRSHFDEIPQLMNVLRGDMSLVGPRPERPQIVEQLSEIAPLYRARLLVPPGISGWAQINYPYSASVEQNLQKTAYDLYYVKNGSVILDIIILVQTLRVILLAEGSR